MTAYFRVTVEDLETGDRQAVEIAEGDFILIPVGGCYLANRAQHANGTVQLTIRDHHPAGPARAVAT